MVMGVSSIKISKFPIVRAKLYCILWASNYPTN